MESLLLLPATLLLLQTHLSTADLIAEPVNPNEPLKPGDYYHDSSPNTVPAFPVQTGQFPPTCHLDLSDELFGGVKEACGRTLDRSRCCPVLAAWLFAAHARSALEISPAPAPSPLSSSSSSSLARVGGSDLLPMMPDDSQKCVNSLQDSLLKRNIVLARPNASCDSVLCFCGIRLHQITSLSCPAAFNLTASSTAAGGHRNATPTAAVKNLEKSCKNSSYAGCTKCVSALRKLKGDGWNGTAAKGGGDGGSRVSKMLNRDCQLMGLTWLLARNKTKYIPTVSAVLRALMYSSHPHESKCSPDQENMPLAVDSLEFDTSAASSLSGPSPCLASLSLIMVVFSPFPILPLIMLLFCT